MRSSVTREVPGKIINTLRKHKRLKAKTHSTQKNKTHAAHNI
uniref:Uncharacterized protein n=1 Tax=Anguilla anguilla TaxID=7936 RepID=A0A0E9XLL5_ANGAN